MAGSAEAPIQYSTVSAGRSATTAFSKAKRRPPLTVSPRSRRCDDPEGLLEGRGPLLDLGPHGRELRLAVAQPALDDEAPAGDGGQGAHLLGEQDGIPHGQQERGSRPAGRPTRRAGAPAWGRSGSRASASRGGPRRRASRGRRGGRPPPARSSSERPPEGRAPRGRWSARSRGACDTSSLRAPPRAPDDRTARRHTGYASRTTPGHHSIQTSPGSAPRRHLPGATPVFHVGINSPSTLRVLYWM